MSKRCRSNIHDQPVPAVTVGVFDCSSMNGNPPETGSPYCLRCAVSLAEAGWFIPTDGTVLPTLAEFVDADPSVHASPATP